MKQDSQHFTLPPLVVLSRAGQTLLKTPEVQFEKGKTIAITGISGSGKTLFLESLFSEKGIFRTKNHHYYMVQNPGGGLTPHLSLKSHLNDLKTSTANKAFPKKPGDKSNHKPESNRYPSSFSGGEKQKIMADMIFSQEPEVLVCDEPGANLDPKISKELFQSILNEKKRRPFTFLFVTHQWALIQQYADEVIVIHGGKLVFKGTFESLILEEKIQKRPHSLNLWLNLQNQDSKPDCKKKNREHTQNQTMEAGHQNAIGPKITSYSKRQEEATTSCAHEELGLSPVIQVSNLTLQYDQRFLFQNFSWKAEPKSWWWAWGPNGSGKSTFGKLLAGLLSPDSGSLSIDGKSSPFPLSQRKKWPIPPVQYAFQHGLHLFNPNRILRHQLKNNYVDDTSRLYQYMESLDLKSSLLDRYPGSLSLGEAQRFNLIRALGTKPNFLICDELFSSLDFSITVRMVEFLKNIQEHEEIAFMLITHDESLFHFRPGDVLKFNH